MLPLDLCHYYDCSQGPFRNLSDLPEAEAERVLNAIRAQGMGFASQRAVDYLSIRRGLEQRVRAAGPPHRREGAAFLGWLMELPPPYRPPLRVGVGKEGLTTVS